MLRHNHLLYPSQWKQNWPEDEGDLDKPAFNVVDDDGSDLPETVVLELALTEDDAELDDELVFVVFVVVVVVAVVRDAV